MVGEGAAHGLDGGGDVLLGVSGGDEPAPERIAVPVDAALLERVAEPGEASSVLQRRRPRSMLSGSRSGAHGEERLQHRADAPHVT